jgi:hypothetical protein
MRNDIATPDRFLSVNDTIAMKAIAILFMLMHHLWAFPDRIAGGPLESILHFSNFPLTVHIGVFGKICVSIFFFLGGYGLYKKYFGKRYNLAERLKKLYFAYWKIFVIFVPIGFIFFSNQNTYCADAGVYSAFSTFSIKEFLLNVTGIESTYNKEWWFLINYAIALVLFPLIRKIVDRFSVGVNITIVVLVTILLTDIFPYAACFWMGAIVAKHSLFDKLCSVIPQNKILRTIIDVSIWLFVIVLRQKITGDQLDIIFVPLITIASIDIVGRLNFLKKCLPPLGKQSTNMWLIHTFFCYYFGVTAKIVAAPRYAIPALIILFAMSYAASVLVDKFWKKAAHFLK